MNLTDDQLARLRRQIHNRPWDDGIGCLSVPYVTMEALLAELIAWRKAYPHGPN